MVPYLNKVTVTVDQIILLTDRSAKASLLSPCLPACLPTLTSCCVNNCTLFLLKQDRTETLQLVIYVKSITAACFTSAEAALQFVVDNKGKKVKGACAYLKCY